MRRCKLCRKEEAVYAMQQIGEDKPSFYTLGSHIRGFAVTPVCYVCAAREESNAIAAKEKAA